MRKGDLKFYIGCVGLALLVLFVYAGIPTGVWLLLGPAGFLQKFLMVVAIALYEWFAFWVGIVFGTVILAVFLD